MLRHPCTQTPPRTRGTPWARIYLIKRERLRLIPEDTFFNATDFMDKLIDQGHKVIRYPISGYWLDIGQHDELARAREMAKHLK